MTENNSKISVITINYNNAAGLRETISSVVNQTYKNIEYLVIDGASTDGSAEIIASFNEQISFWVSEKDQGIYQAMNKGIAHATGDYLLFLNSGDRFMDTNSIEKVVKAGLNADLVYGNLLFFDDQKEWTWQLPQTLTFEIFYTSTIAHPSTLIKKKLFDQLGGYDENLKIVADWKFFMLAFAKLNCSYQHIDQIISVYRFDGISSRPENLALIHAERSKVLAQEFPAFVADYQTLENLKLEAKKFRRFMNFGRTVRKILKKK